MAPSMTQLLIILLVVVVLFGAKKLPEIGGGLGKAIKNFKKASLEPDEIDITPTKKSGTKKKAAAPKADDEA